MGNSFCPCLYPINLACLLYNRIPADFVWVSVWLWTHAIISTQTNDAFASGHLFRKPPLRLEYLYRNTTAWLLQLLLYLQYYRLLFLLTKWPHSKCKARDLFSGGFELLICCIGCAEITLLACLLGLPLLLRGSLVHQKIKWCLHNGWQQVLHLDFRL